MFVIQWKRVLDKDKRTSAIERETKKSAKKTNVKIFIPLGFCLSTKKLKKSANDCVKIWASLQKSSYSSHALRFALKRCWLPLWFITIFAKKSFSLHCSGVYSICHASKRPKAWTEWDKKRKESKIGLTKISFHPILNGAAFFSFIKYARTPFQFVAFRMCFILHFISKNNHRSEF